MARVLIPGVLAGVAISLIANIVIGGIFYNLFNNTAVGTLAGTLTASVVGAILGVIAISTANRKDTAVVLRGAAAGAFIGVISGFLGTVSTDELEGVGSNVALISVVVGGVVGAAGLRGTGMRFASAWVDEDEEMGALGRTLDGVFAGIMIGVACALPIVLFYGGDIHISPHLIDRVRVEFVRVTSLDELLIGGVSGIIIGAIVGLALSRKRVDGLLNAMLIGALAGIILALPNITVMTFTQLGGIWSGILPFGRIALAMLGGAALGAAMPGASFTGRYRGALVGAGVGVVFALPFVIASTLLEVYASDSISTVGADSPSYASDGIDTVGTDSPPDPSLWDKFLSLNRGNSIHLITSAVIGAMIGLITSEIMRRGLGTCASNYAVYVVVIAAAIGVQSRYFLLLLGVFLFGYGIELPRFLYDSQPILALPRRLVVGVALGALASTIGAAIARRLPARQSQS